MGKALTHSPQRRFTQFEQLRAPIERGALAQFRAALIRRWPQADEERGGPMFWVGIVLMGSLVVSLVILPAGLGISVLVAAPASISFFLATLAVSALIAWPVALWTRRFVRREVAARGSWRHWYRMTRFAALNDLAYLPSREARGPTSLVFSALPLGEYRDVFVDGRAPMLQFGNRVPWKDAGLASWGETAWSFLTIELRADAARMLLTPTHARPRFVQLGEQLSVPSDFEYSYALWGTAGSFEDPLEVITPQLMKLLVDELPGSFVEAAGRQLVITTPRPWNLERDRSWTLIERVVEAVPASATESTGTELVPQGAVMPRVTPGLVAPPPRSATLLRPSWIGIGIGLLIATTQIIRIIAQQHPSCGC